MHVRSIVGSFLGWSQKRALYMGTKDGSDIWTIVGLQKREHSVENLTGYCRHCWIEGSRPRPRELLSKSPNACFVRFLVFVMSEVESKRAVDLDLSASFPSQYCHVERSRLFASFNTYSNYFRRSETIKKDIKPRERCKLGNKLPGNLLT